MVAFGRTLQQPPSQGVPPNLHAARHLLSLVMTADADALHHGNRQDWGEHASKATTAEVASHCCCPALWQVGNARSIYKKSPFMKHAKA